MTSLRLVSLSVFVAACTPTATSPALNDGGGSPNASNDAQAPIGDAGNVALDAGLDDTGEPASDAGTPQGDRPLLRRVTDHRIDQVINGATVSRGFHIMAPSTIDENRRYPVVIAFHGKGGRGRSFVSSMIPFVDAGRFVAILPDGIDNGWNLGSNPEGPDDLAFVDLLLTELRAFRGLDFSRVYALGFSNGAALVHMLAATRSHFRAHAAMATALIAGNEPGDDVHRASFLSVHGMDDVVCPYEGGPGRVRLNFLAAEASAALWAEQLGCPSEADRSTTNEGNRRFVYAPCDDGHRVEHYGIEGSGHSIPRDSEGGLYNLIVTFFEETP